MLPQSKEFDIPDCFNILERKTQEESTAKPCHTIQQSARATLIYFFFCSGVIVSFKDGRYSSLTRRTLMAIMAAAPVATVASIKMT